MSSIHFLTGGSRSGKSTKALELTQTYERKAFIATAQAFDDEMRERIKKHQEERGNEYQNFEAPLKLAEAITEASKVADVIVVDCLTVWLGNLMYYNEKLYPHYPEIEEYYKALESCPKKLVIVSNELGMGLIPETSLGRKFRDLAGRINQETAKRATEVTFVVSGLPLKLK